MSEKASKVSEKASKMSEKASQVGEKASKVGEQRVERVACVGACSVSICAFVPVKQVK